MFRDTYFRIRYHGLVTAQGRPMYPSANEFLGFWGKVDVPQEPDLYKALSKGA
jgi:hypothetical protein